VAIQFNHTIVPARDAKASATWLSEVLGRERAHELRFRSGLSRSTTA